MAYKPTGDSWAMETKEFDLGGPAHFWENLERADAPPLSTGKILSTVISLPVSEGCEVQGG